jgi:sugar-specific transcriptional regulator TrmB
MIIKPEFVKKIKDYFDLNIYETKVWIALLGKGVASAGEIAEISGVPRSRTYDVLEGLEKRGFAMQKIGKPVKYLAVNPKVVIEKLKSNVLTDAGERVKSLVGLKDTNEYSELELLHKNGISPIKNSDLSSSIRGKINLYSHLKEMLENASKEVIMVISAEELKHKARIFAPIFDRIRKSSLNLKIAINSSEIETKEINKKYKVDAKHADIKGRFFIVDRKEVLFMVSDEDKKDSEAIGIWLNSEFFASAMAFLFDKAWEKISEPSPNSNSGKKKK